MKNSREQLFIELIRLLVEAKNGSILHEEHEIKRGECFIKRKYETTSLGKKGSTSVKIEVHTWGRS